MTSTPVRAARTSTIAAIIATIAAIISVVTCAPAQAPEMAKFPGEFSAGIVIDSSRAKYAEPISTPNLNGEVWTMDDIPADEDMR